MYASETWIIIIISDFSSLNYLFGVRFVITKSCSEYYVRWLHRIIIVWCNIDFHAENNLLFFLEAISKFKKSFWKDVLPEYRFHFNCGDLLIIFERIVVHYFYLQNKCNGNFSLRTVGLVIHHIIKLNINGCILFNFLG